MTLQGTTGIGTSIGTVKITFAENAIVTASLAVPGPVTVFSPPQGASNVSLVPALTWTASRLSAASYDIYFGTSSSPPYVASTTGTSYSPGTLAPNTTYYWYLISQERNAGSTASLIWSFATRSDCASAVLLRVRLL